MDRRQWHWLVLLTFALVASTVTAHAQRVVLPAPPPAGSQPAWLDNFVTQRFVEWQQLERDWRATSAQRGSSAFAPRALAICAHALDLPQEGQPQPGMRARILNESCPAALDAAAQCYASVRTTFGERRWLRGFERAQGQGAQGCGDAQLRAALT